MATTIQSSPLHFIIKDFTFEFLSLLWISSIHSFNRSTLHMLDKRQKNVSYKINNYTFFYFIVDPLGYLEQFLFYIIVLL
jgi:hypothetical protein